MKKEKRKNIDLWVFSVEIFTIIREFAFTLLPPSFLFFFVFKKLEIAP